MAGVHDRRSADVSPFHAGELATQARLGVRETIDPWARKVVRPFLPQQHRDFYRRLPFVVVAARDCDGRPWATLLTAAPGFVRSPDPRSLEFQALPRPGDALDGALVAGADLGVLGIDLQTRRRNRVNGSLSQANGDGLRLAVRQTFGNCPRYITQRRWRRVSVDPDAASATRHGRLDDAMRAWIEKADTLFVASGYRGGEQGEATEGMDASHRGGTPGFVKVTGNGQLAIPDYAGNNHFNTLGNLVLDPRVGLLFVDFERGSLLQLSGRARIDWNSPGVAKHPGAQRLVVVTIERIVRLDRVLPLRWDASDTAQQTLRLTAKTRESADVTSFEFVSGDGKGLAGFQAGQYLPIELSLAKGKPGLVRTYSLSNAPGGDRYRISVKREPRGTASQHLHDAVRVGDVIRSGLPGGEFVLQKGHRPVALVGAGIGITPLASMLHDLARTDRQRKVYVVHGVRDGRHHPLRREIERLALEYANIELLFVYSRSGGDSAASRGRIRHGRIDGPLLDDFVPGLAADFYLCGPPGFLTDISDALQRRGVNAERIRVEVF